jgi:glycosyltransferase involved in cell wall biosynthesis
MRIALDGQLAVGTATGIGEYARGAADALRARGVDVALLRWPALDPWRFDRRVVWDQIGLPLQAALSHADLLHCASGTMPLVCTLPTVVTVHDVAWLRVQAHARAYARAYFGRFALSQYPRARRIIVDSQFSRDELVASASIDPKRVDVVYPGVAEEFMHLERRPDPEPFVLVVGTVERRKNLAVVIRALPALERVRLISVGPPTPYATECARLAQELGVEDRVSFHGYVSREELLDLYARAAVVAVPSTYEGFGYAAAQALCAAAPVLAARCASLPEVLGDDAALLDPNDADAWSEAIGRILADGAAAQRHARATRESAAARFSWPVSSGALLASYEAALTDSAARLAKPSA